MRLVGERLEQRCVLAGGPIVSEWMAVNHSTVQDDDGDFSDWLEIHNPTAEPLDLAGWYITDSVGRLNKWGLPSVSLGAGDHLLIFASGKDRATAEALHANFKLDGDGEYLALVESDGTTIAWQIAPTYPRQTADVSYGVDESLPDQPWYLGRPTPGEANDLSQVFAGIAADPAVSVVSGFYENSFQVSLSTQTADALIRYTTDGSAPSTRNGQVYTAPIEITTTTVLRATAFHVDYLTSRATTRSYLFLDDVLLQDGAGLPATWGTIDADFPLGTYRAGDPVPANYGMDSEVVNDPRYADTLKDDLRAIPTLSLAIAPVDLWSTQRGIYSNTLESGVEWERPVAAELIDTDGSTLFQLDAGVRIHGGFSRMPSASAKHSLRLLFKDEYGPGKLNYPWFGPDAVDEFDTIVLRASYNFSWARGERNNTQHSADGTFVQDRWASVAQQQMGGLSPHGAWVHLYLNGLYWGLYNPNERPSAPFQASYQGGEREEFDVLKIGEVIDGDRVAWNELISLVRANPIDYDAVTTQLDVDGFIDYMIINHIGGNEDWPQNNWYASRRRQPDAKWLFHSWDAEFLFRDVNLNRLSAGGNDGPGEIYQRLRTVAEFRLAFADRVHRYLMNDGLLTPAANIARLDVVAAPIDRAVVGESARWGDALFDNIEPPRTRDDHWLPRLEQLRTEYFPIRTDIVLSQYRAADLYPSLEAPRFNQHGGPFSPGFQLEMSAPAGTIVYTLDGTDPRLPGGAVNPAAITYDGPITLSDSTTVKARVRNARSGYSALNEATFVSEQPPALRISEIMYHPRDPAAGSAYGQNDFEFVELVNVGQTPLPLAGVSLSEGVQFTFADGDIDPGERVVLVNNADAFREQYGDAVEFDGEFIGNLSNAGERLVLTGAVGETILDFTYQDHWQPVTDGDGYSLVIVDAAADPSTWSLPTSWRPSRRIDGSPGIDDPPTTSGDADGDGDVDIDDLNAVRNHFGGAGAGDTDGDGDVDIDDLNNVRNHFGATPAGLQAAVLWAPDSLSPTAALDSRFDRSHRRGTPPGSRPSAVAFPLRPDDRATAESASRHGFRTDHDLWRASGRGTIAVSDRFRASAGLDPATVDSVVCDMIHGFDPRFHDVFA